jgi:Fic family protein
MNRQPAPVRRFCASRIGVSMPAEGAPLPCQGLAQPCVLDRKRPFVWGKSTFGDKFRRNATEHDLARLKEGFPLCLRLFREIHGILLSQGSGSAQTPGEFRRSQNWIGGTCPGNAVFVPPPPDRVMDCMGKLEFFLHDKPQATPILEKAALAHVQFETIHPFLDGNGRLGRLLITLLFCEQKALPPPCCI